MEVSALRYSGGIGLYGRSPLLRLQSDERLISLVRRGSPAAFEMLVSRYQSRLLAFCRHLVGSREDAEDVLQEVLAAAFNAMTADERPINVRPWLYRIARNRCLNHLRRIQAVGVDSMDVHLSEHGTSTADKVHGAEEFRMLVADIGQLPETQRTALVLREMDALSYEQIAEAMETTVPSVKSLLVRARVSLAEAAEARMLTCEQVRVELAEAAEGLRKKCGPLVRRHLRSCKRCSVFQSQLKKTNKALTALLPLGPVALLRKLAITHIGHSAGAGSSASGAGAAGQAAALGSTAAAGTTAMLGSGAGGIISVSIGTIATKAAAGLAAAALVTAGAVEVVHTAPAHHHAAPVTPAGVAPSHLVATVQAVPGHEPAVATPTHHRAAAAGIHPVKHKLHPAKPADARKLILKPSTRVLAAKKDRPVAAHKPKPPPGRTQTQTSGTILPGTTTPGTPATVNDRPPAAGGTVPTNPVASPQPLSTTTTTGPTITPPTTAAPTSTATAPPATSAPAVSPPRSISITGSAPVRHEERTRREHRRHRLRAR